MSKKLVDSPVFEFELGAPIIEFYGPTLRYGVEGKWVNWIVLPNGRPKRREVLALIAEEDKRRTQ
jgi:hypothetical protein